ncbi:MAG: bifunctional UDP-N-acetylglucosamine diphosphorylase/glucosamine-1-phosphate N-acetyltransferase GlmU [Desulfitobacteriaceae bacterium]|nr:bifunctional UDP-N-acetylglucosamine diphosphorylase/glucosamine-1-phosphate N-acetyltransferase GlmU [Desulfitobacteriaceae bacterium]MDD4346251.1 bifunctional UDP-N-acetylglucosamine diphosphorylase/glucosamine-1-phosphate N-acetyltransferase GlmU [Desulfitobacteriaceae bacterium]MDD4400279.1 bifunctional UDP-N-acetylglucosamine diphosphorylase/glucosamine-1-phosphate N-acetyltransferase GlmU [Desulfitobacteriaceae bacterium]
MPNLAVVIMAAGKGTRMKSKLPKVMHKIAGKSLIEHVLDAVSQVGTERPVVILGYGRETVEKLVSDRCQIAVQAEQLGTGHAIIQALPYLDEKDDVIILSGDQPLLKPETLLELIRLHREHKATATVLTAMLNEPYGYGRIIKNGQELERIVEEKDAAPEERKIKEINTGTYCFKVLELKEALSQITPKNSQGEYYLTDVFNIFLAKAAKVLIHCTLDSNEALGINSRSQLAEAEKICYERVRQHWMNEGVTIVDPASTFIDDDVKLAPDVCLMPFTIIKSKTEIREDAVIGPQVLIESCICGEGCEINYTVAREAVISEGCKVGPYAYLRPGTYLEANVKIGDFVEVKKSHISAGTKIPHLSYIGDAEVGKSVNIGAGTITCNYDGFKKSPTKICDHAFIGSNTNLVAPVEIGEGAVTGAGSTITENVPAKALAVERSKQMIKNQYVKDKK